MQGVHRNRRAGARNQEPTLREAGRGRLTKRLKLAGLALAGLATVSIPVTVAIVMSATGTSDLLTLGGAPPRAQEHQTAAEALAGVRCEPRRGFYALTFDDGPLPESTPRLVAALKRARAVATFFDVGGRAAAYPELVELQRSVGQVASQGYTHVRLSTVSRERRVQELQATARVLDYPNALFRPPYGETTPETEADVSRAGLTTVLWTVDAGDTQGTVAEIVARASAAEPGDIVLLHDGVDRTVQAVPQIVAELRARGLCPGFVAPTAEPTVSADGRSFHATAVKP